MKKNKKELMRNKERRSINDILFITKNNKGVKDFN